MVGLGPHMLLRARIIFLIVAVLAVASSITAIYKGFESGDLQKRFVEPVKTFGQNMVKSWEVALEPAPDVTTTFTYTATSSSTVRVNNNGKETTTNSVKYTAPKAIYVAPSQNASELFWQQAELNNKEFEERVKQQRDASQKAYQERVSQMNADYQKRVQQMNSQYEQNVQQGKAASEAWYQNAVQEQQKKLEEWKKSSGF